MDYKTKYDTLFHPFCLLCHSVDHSFYPNGNKSGSVQPSPGRHSIITNVWIKINQRINQIAMKCHVQMRQNRRFRRSFTAWKIQDSETFEIIKKTLINHISHGESKLKHEEQRRTKEKLKAVNLARGNAPTKRSDEEREFRKSIHKRKGRNGKQINGWTL